MGNSSDDELELRAIEEQFAAEVRAGKRPHIADYLMRAPAHADAFVEFAAALLAGDVGDVGDVGTREETKQARRAAPSSGALRALDALFGEEASGRKVERPLGKVAEQRASYGLPSERLAALAQSRGVTLAALAEAVDLPPAVLEALATGELRDGAPAALLARVAAALGVGPSRVAEALAAPGSTTRGQHPVDPAAQAETPATFRELIATHPAVTPEQRAQWLALLEAEEG